MASSFFPVKYSGSTALYSASVDIWSFSMWLSSAGSKVSSSSLVISILGSRMGSKLGLGRVERVMGRGSNAAGNS